MRKSATNQEIQELVTRARRDQILDAACEVFASKGFQRATMREVAEMAGVATGTIYTYFENKTALLFGILDRLNETENREEHLNRSSGANFRDFFGEYLRHRFAALSGSGLKAFRVLVSEVLVNPELRALYRERIAEPTFALAEKQFARLAETGQLRFDNVALTVRAVAASFVGLLVMRLMGDATLEKAWGELPDLLETLLLDGLQGEEGG